MIYLFTFLLCLFAEKLRPKNNLGYILIVIWLYVFLCFGYMTGSDWREYELLYNSGDLNRIISKGEYGFVWLVSCCKLFISDFWIFNALVKIFFLYELIRFFGYFTDNRIMALGLSFCFHTLFMLIDCPMRFMIGVSFLLMSIKYLIMRKWMQFLLLLVISISFHTSLLVVGTASIMVFLLSPLIAKISSRTLYFVFFLCLFISNHSIVKETIYSIGEKFSLFSDYLYSYGLDRAQDFTLMSLLKTAFIGTFLIMNRKNIQKRLNGDFIFGMAYYSLTIGLFLGVIPTGFRFNIVPQYFQVIAFTILFCDIKYRGPITHKHLIKYSFVLLFVFLLVKEVQSPKYTPYSNSISYILTEHLPYSYRNTHNYVP